MNTLDTWEAEAKKKHYTIPSGVLIEDELDRRILALIDLIREKDIRIGFINECKKIKCDSCLEAIQRALSLTESIK